jgi:hypothetical protein
VCALEIRAISTNQRFVHLVQRSQQSDQRLDRMIKLLTHRANDPNRLTKRSVLEQIIESAIYDRGRTFVAI